MSPESTDRHRGHDRGEAQGKAGGHDAANSERRKDGPNIPYNRVDAKSPQEQEKAERNAQDRLEDAKRDEQARKAEQNAKSSQAPISKDGQSSHPSQTGQTGDQRSIPQQVADLERGHKVGGAGTSTLNQGASDTKSADPHRPPNYPPPGGGPQPDSQADTSGTGQHPPSGAAPQTTPDNKENQSQ